MCKYKLLGITRLHKDVRWLLSPFVALLFNTSLVSGCFPSDFKEAVIRPLLKKSGLDTSELKNFRPVSNLSFLSKLLQRVVQIRLQVFLDSSNMMPPMQSAYRRYYSTETAVTKVNYNDLLLAADAGHTSVGSLSVWTYSRFWHRRTPVTLASSRASVWSAWCCRGVVLAWFSSYLTGRSFRVGFNGQMFSVVYILCSIPRGWVLGPRLFVLYMVDLVEVTDQYDVNVHLYADDTQLHLQCSVVTRHPPLHVLDIVSTISATGRQQIVCRWILPRLSCCGLASSTTFRC